VRCEQHSGSTDPALRRPMFDERLLQPRKLAVLRRQPFYCYDISTFHLAYGYQTAVDDLAVDQHGARTALTLTAAFFRPRRTEIFAQHVKQTACTNDVERNRSSV